MSRLGTVIEVEPWRETTLRCGIGHTYRGRVRQVKWQTFDMDGEPMWQGPADDFDPEMCIVCGLLTWATVKP
jgi:hypothetical protein